MDAVNHSTETLQAVIDILSHQPNAVMSRKQLGKVQGIKAKKQILTTTAATVLARRYYLKMSEYDNTELGELSSLIAKTIQQLRGDLPPEYIQRISSGKRQSKAEHTLAEYLYNFNISGSDDPCALGQFPILDTLDHKFDQYVYTTLETGKKDLEIDIIKLMDGHPIFMAFVTPILLSVIASVITRRLQGGWQGKKATRKKKGKKSCKPREPLKVSADTKLHVLRDRNGKVYTMASLNPEGSQTIH